MAHYHEIFKAHGGTFTLRNAESADAAQIIAFAEQLVQETGFLNREPGEFTRSHPLEKEGAHLAAVAESPEELFLLAVTPDDGKIAGQCMCSYSAARAKSRHRATIGVSILKEFWRQGLGRRMFEIALEWAKQNHVEKITLEVDTLNTRAIGLYTAMGFVTEGTLHRHFKLSDGSYRDVYVMAKFL